MGQNNRMGQVRSEAALAEELAERTQLQELNDLFVGFDQLLSTFTALASPQEMKDAEGRRCILQITGLKYHQTAFFFEVSGASVRQVAPFENYTTYIGASLPTVLRVLRGVLAGSLDAFNEEWSRGAATLKGDHSIHDGFQFMEVFRRLARVVQRYNAMVKQ